LHLKEDWNVEIQLKHNNRKTVVHAKTLLGCKQKFGCLSRFSSTIATLTNISWWCQPPPCQKITHLYSVLYCPISGRSEFLNLPLSFTPPPGANHCKNTSAHTHILFFVLFSHLPPWNIYRRCTPIPAHVEYSLQLVVTFHPCKN
jgi:hypothetical protein